MLSIVAPGGLEKHFRDPRFSEPAKDTTLPTPGGAPDLEVLEAMAEDLASYGTEVVDPPARRGKARNTFLLSELPRTPTRSSQKAPSTRVNRALLACMLALWGGLGAQPQRDMGRLHRLPGHPHQIVA